MNHPPRICDRLPWPGDILVSSSTEFPGPQIRWLTSARGESSTYASHVGIMLGPWAVAEALWKGTKETRYIPKYLDIPHRIYRLQELPSGKPVAWKDRLALAGLALSQCGKRYGFHSLLLHGIDGLINKVWRGNDELFLARRACTDRWLAICSQVVAHTYWQKFRYIFGVTPEWADPDHIDDHCSRYPWWEMVREVTQ